MHKLAISTWDDKEIEAINNVVKSEETHGLKLDNYKSSKTFFDVTPHEDY